MTSDEAQIQIFADGSVSYAKRAKKNNKKNLEYHFVVERRRLLTAKNCPIEYSWPNHIKNERSLSHPLMPNNPDPTRGIYFFRKIALNWAFTYCQVTRRLVSEISESRPISNKHKLLPFSHRSNSFRYTLNCCASRLNSVPNLFVWFILAQLENLVRTFRFHHCYLIRWFHDVFKAVDGINRALYGEKSGKIGRVRWYRYKNKEPVASS